MEGSTLSSIITQCTLFVSLVSFVLGNIDHYVIREGLYQTTNYYTKIVISNPFDLRLQCIKKCHAEYRCGSFLIDPSSNECYFFDACDQQALQGCAGGAGSCYNVIEILEMERKCCMKTSCKEMNGRVTGDINTKTYSLCDDQNVEIFCSLYESKMFSHVKTDKLGEISGNALEGMFSNRTHIRVVIEGGNIQKEAYIKHRSHLGNIELPFAIFESHSAIAVFLYDVIVSDTTGGSLKTGVAVNDNDLSIHTTCAGTGYTALVVHNKWAVGSNAPACTSSFSTLMFGKMGSVPSQNTISSDFIGDGLIATCHCKDDNFKMSLGFF